MAASTASKATGPICAKLSARWPGTMLLFRLCLVILFCEPLAEARHNDAPYLLVSQERLIWRMGLDGSEATVLVRETNGRVNAFDYHYRLRYVFWLNVMTKSINRAHLEDGSGAIMVVNFLTRPGAEPAGIAVDWIEDTLYWTDQNRHMIEVYNIRTGIEGMVLNTMSLPYGIAVDPISGWLYWADRERRLIERQNITGTERDRVQSVRLPCTVAITLDQDGDEILWCDLCYFRVERSNTDGSSRRIIARQVYFCSGLAAFQEYVYWTQGSPTTALCRTNKHGQGQKEVVANGNSTGRFYGVVVVHPMKQPLPAYYYAGDCEYFHNCSATISSSVASTPTPSMTSFTTLSITTVLSSSYLRPSPTFHSSQQIISTEGVLSSRGSSASPSPIQPTSVVSSDVASMPTTTSPWLSVSSTNPKLHSSTAISSIQPSNLTPTPSVQSTGPDSTSHAPSSQFDLTSSSVVASTKVPSATTAGSSTAFHSLISSLETATSRHTQTTASSTFTAATTTGALRPSSPLISSTPVTSRHTQRETSSTFTTVTTTAIAPTSVIITATSASSGVSKSPPVQGTASERGMEMLMLIIYGNIGSAVVLFALIVMMCCLVCVKAARRSHKRAKRSYTMPVHNCLSLYPSPGEVAAKSLYDIPEPVLAARCSPIDSEGSSSSPSVTSPMLRRALPAIKPQVLDLADLVPGANGVAPAKE